MMGSDLLRRASWTVLLAACSTSSPSAQGVIGPSGGEVAAGDSVTIVIPPGALPGNTTITAVSTDAAPPASTVEVNTPYLFGPEGTQFEAPVTVTLAFTPSLVPTDKTPADIVIYTAPAGTTAYQPLQTTVADNSHVTAQTTHFSIFLAAVETGDDSHVDASTIPDASPDAPTTCTPVVAGGSLQCTVTASCNGHSYEAECAQGCCRCVTDGVPAQQQMCNNLGATCSGTSGQPGWGACGFP